MQPKLSKIKWLSFNLHSIQVKNPRRNALNEIIEIIVAIYKKFTYIFPKPNQAAYGRTYEGTWEVALPVPDESRQSKVSFQAQY